MYSVLTSLLLQHFCVSIRCNVAKLVFDWDPWESFKYWALSQQEESMKFMCYACFTDSFLISRKNITTALTIFEVYMLKFHISECFVTLTVWQYWPRIWFLQMIWWRANTSRPLVDCTRFKWLCGVQKPSSVSAVSFGRDR